jgi:hypothetical protein
MAENAVSVYVMTRRREHVRHCYQHTKKGTARVKSLCFELFVDPGEERSRTGFASFALHVQMSRITTVIFCASLGFICVQSVLKSAGVTAKHPSELAGLLP